MCVKHFKNVQAGTVPCKCKLTVPRNLNFETRSSILETQKLRVSRLESSASSIESSASSFETGKQRTFRVISFSHVLSEATVSLVPFYRNCLYLCRDAFLLERCAFVFDTSHVYAQAGKSSLSKRFVGSLPITTESIVRF